MSRQLLLLVFLSTVLSACGGGGGGGGDASPQTPVARFSIDRASVSFSGEVGQGRPAPQAVTGTVTNATGSIFIVVEYTNPEVVDDVTVNILGSVGEMTIFPASADILGAGSYSSEIRVSVCNDAGCQSQVAGSPRLISVDYTVEPAPPPPDRDGDGFEDANDAFPDDPTEWSDNDGDGTGDNADTDDDNDGVADDEDEFPFDGSLSVATTQVNITVTGNGSVASSGLSGDCTTSCDFTIDNTVAPDTDFTANAGANYTFTSWGSNGLCDDTDTNCAVSTAYTATVDINVVFSENPFMSLIIDPDVNGTVIEKFGELQCADYCEFKLYEPETQRYELVGLPKPGYDFDGWTNAECGSGENCEFAVQHNTTLALSPTYTANGGDFDLCPGDPSATFTGSGDDDVGATGDVLALCNGTLILTEIDQNKIIVRDVVNSVTSHEFQLSAQPWRLALIEELKLLYVTHASTTHVSRIDLRTGNVTEIFVEEGAESVAASDDGTLFIQGNDFNLHIYDSQTTMWNSSQLFPERRISYNDVTSRLIGWSNNYFWDVDSGELTMQGPAQGGGSSCSKYVTVSPDGDHAAFPCGAGNGPGYTVYDFYSHDPDVVFGEWNTDAYPSGAAFAPSSKFIVLTNRRDIQLFNVDTHALEVEIPMDICTYGQVQVVAASSDGKLFYGITQCGFDRDRAVIDWYAFDMN